MVNKQSFYESINQDTIIDETFFRKVLGYSMYDKPFLRIIAEKLASIGRSDAVQAYNAWYATWKATDYQRMKKIAEWYHKECDREFAQRHKVQKKAVREWKKVNTWQTIAEILNYRRT